MDFKKTRSYLMQQGDLDKGSTLMWCLWANFALKKAGRGDVPRHQFIQPARRLLRVIDVYRLRTERPYPCQFDFMAYMHIRRGGRH